MIGSAAPSPLNSAAVDCERRRCSARSSGQQSPGLVPPANSSRARSVSRRSSSGVRSTARSVQCAPPRVMTPAPPQCLYRKVSSAPAARRPTRKAGNAARTAVTTSWPRSAKRRGAASCRRRFRSSSSAAGRSRRRTAAAGRSHHSGHRVRNAPVAAADRSSNARSPHSSDVMDVRSNSNNSSESVNNPMLPPLAVSRRERRADPAADVVAAAAIAEASPGRKTNSNSKSSRSNRLLGPRNSRVLHSNPVHHSSRVRRNNKPQAVRPRKAGAVASARGAAAGSAGAGRAGVGAVRAGGRRRRHRRRWRLAASS